MPATYNFIVYQGTDYAQQLIWRDNGVTPVNLTGFTARMQIRKRVSSETPFIELTTENGGITLGGALGTIDLHMTPAQTAALSWRGEAVYDLELVPANGAVTRLMEGKVILSPEVTRPVTP